MKKIQHLRLKLALTVLYLVALALANHFGFECVWRHFFGVSCPGCGMSRAWQAAFRLDFPTALACHPMFWSVPVLYAFILTDGRLFSRKWVNTLLLSLIGAGFVILWALRLIMAETV